MCGFSFEPDGTVVSTMAAGDCKKRECNTSHVAMAEADSTDPYYDGNECTADGCNGMTPENTPLPDETPCPGGMGYCCTDQECNLTPNGIACRECHPNVAGTCTGTTPVCQKGKCVPGTCTNTMKDANEGGPDCGGPCALCAFDAECTIGSNCESGVCTGTPKKCAMPTCSDNIKNGKETGADCGGADCATQKCPDGLPCVFWTDCESGVCKMNACQTPTCTDGVRNGSETDIDCDGTCSPCP
jgi:hypothetical protein